MHLISVFIVETAFIFLLITYSLVTSRRTFAPTAFVSIWFEGEEVVDGEDEVEEAMVVGEVIATVVGEGIAAVVGDGIATLSAFNSAS